MPEGLAGGGVVRVDAGAGVDDQLVALRAGDHERGAVRNAAVAAVDLPTLFASDGIEGEQVGDGLVVAQ